MMQIVASLKNKLALHKFVKLRQRYILTKSNNVRLRYSLSVLTVCSAFILTLGNFSAFSVFLDILDVQKAKAMPGAIPDDPAADPGFASNLQGQISESIRKASAAIQKPPVPLDKDLEIGSGDTVAGVLQKAGLNGTDSYRTVEALKTYFDPRKVKPGQALKVYFKPGEGENSEYQKMTMSITPVKDVSIIKKGDEFVAEVYEKELKPRSYARAAEIETSLYGSATKAGIPPQVIAEVIRIYSWNVDFQRDIRQGDKIEVLYDTQETEDGEFTQYGDILYAKLSVGGKDIPIYRYEMSDGRVDYFEQDGRSIRKTLMKTPIDGARLSSGFGMRKHPVLGYNKMHKGVDFAAPTGTPIYAAGDGTVEYAARFSSYGNYVKIRHNSSLKTAYAHLHKFGKGISKGVRVKQGQIIGYVGTTGRSTGPHLHYEVMVNNVQKNPNSVDLPTGEQLAGQELKRFQDLLKSLQQQYVSLSEGLKYAQKDKDGKDAYFLR